MNQVAIIGTGRLGTRLAEQIILEGICEKLVLWNRSQRRLRGTLQSLRMWSDLVDAKTELGSLEWQDLNKIDLVVIAVKENYDPRELFESESFPEWLPHDLRYVGLSRDIHQIRDICEKLRNYRGMMLVLTNPLDVMTCFAQAWVPKATVLGAGLTIDEARIKYFLSRVSGKKIRDLDCPVAGEHGPEVIPLFSMWNPTKQKLEKQGVNIGGVLKETSAFGINVVRDLGYTVQDCAVVFCNDIAWLLEEKPSPRCRCFSIFRNRVSVGWPVRVPKRGVVEVAPPSEVESDDITRAGEKIKGIVTNAAKTWLNTRDIGRLL